MKAVILNSGLGSRMGKRTELAPKCFLQLENGENILSRQIRLLSECQIDQILITTGPFPGMIQHFVEDQFPQVKFEFVENARYKDTNYIYSLYLAKGKLDDDIILMHGDLVFEKSVLCDVIAHPNSCMVCDKTLPLPEKDFKAVVVDGEIQKVGIDFFENAVAAQPLYKLTKADWRVWENQIAEYCQRGVVKVYAENAFNEVSAICNIYPLDAAGRICGEIDTEEDLCDMNERLNSL